MINVFETDPKENERTFTFTEDSSMLHSFLLSEKDHLFTTETMTTIMLISIDAMQMFGKHSTGKDFVLTAITVISILLSSLEYL